MSAGLPGFVMLTQDTWTLDTGLLTLDSRFDGRVIWFKSGPNVVQSSATFKLNNLFNQMH